MKRLLKTLISIVIVLFVLFTVAVVCLIIFLNPNNFKGQLSTAVHDKTGRTLVINGTIERSFFPWLGLRIHDVQLSNAVGFAPANFVSVGEADVSVKLLPLLSGNVEVAKLSLKDFTLNLAENKQGQNNWQDLTTSNNPASAQPATNATPATQTTTTTTKTSGRKPFNFSVDSIDIQNANVSWVSEKTGQNAQLQHLDFSSQGMGFNKTFPLNVKFAIQSVKPQIAGEFSLQTRATLQPQQKTYQFDKLRFSAKLPTMAEPVQLVADSILADLKQQTLSASNAKLVLGNMTAQLNLTGQQLATKPQFTGHIVVAQFDLRELLKTLGKNFATQDPNAMQHVALTADFAASPTALQLNNISGKLDDSTIDGNFAINNFAAKLMNFTVNINQLDLDRYMPAHVATKTPTPATATAAAVSTTTQVAVSNNKYAALRQAKVNGLIKVGSLTLAKTQLTQVSAQLVLQNGVLQINPLTANVYQGTTHSQITADFRGNSPRITMDEKLANVQVNQLTKSDRLTGTANITSHLTMQGEQKNTLLRTLNGNMQFNIQNGALLGADIPYQINRAIAKIKKQPEPPQPAENRTEFGQFSGTGTFQNGVFNNNDLLLQSSEIKITGNGTANLVTTGLNYHLSALSLTNTQGGDQNQPMALPLLVTGTFSHPIITPDIEALARSLLKSGIKTKLEELRGVHRGLMLDRLLFRR